MSVAETMKATTDCAKKLIEAPRYNVGDFVGVYEYETDVRIHDIRWEGSCFVYKVYLADEETWLYDDDIADKKDEMIEGLVEEEVGLVDNLSSRWVNEFNLLDGYIFKDENGNVINATKIVLEKKKKEYPKTYDECKRIMGVGLWNTLWGEDATEYEEQTEKLIDAFIRLKVCRDAYWKIAGEEMGLGKPWEPDSNSGYFIPAIIYRSGSIQKVEVQYRNAILSFPTPEMRDAFKENFDPDIEICKELL